MSAVGSLALRNVRAVLFFPSVQCRLYTVCYKTYSVLQMAVGDGGSTMERSIWKGHPRATSVLSELSMMCNSFLSVSVRHS